MLSKKKYYNAHIHTYIHIFLTEIHVYFPTVGKAPVGPMQVDLYIYIYIYIFIWIIFYTPFSLFLWPFCLSLSVSLYHKLTRSPTPSVISLPLSLPIYIYIYQLLSVSPPLSPSQQLYLSLHSFDSNVICPPSPHQCQHRKGFLKKVNSDLLPTLLTLLCYQSSIQPDKVLRLITVRPLITSIITIFAYVTGK